MDDPDKTGTNWQTKWARARAWVIANPKAARSIAWGLVAIVIFFAGAVIF